MARSVFARDLIQATGDFPQWLTFLNGGLKVKTAVSELTRTDAGQLYGNDFSVDGISATILLDDLQKVSQNLDKLIGESVKIDGNADTLYVSSFEVLAGDVAVVVYLSRSRD